MLMEFVGFGVVSGLWACGESFCQEQSPEDPRTVGIWRAHDLDSTAAGL